MKKIDILKKFANGKLSVREVTQLLKQKKPKKEKPSNYDILPVVSKYKGPSTFDSMRMEHSFNVANVYNILVNSAGDWFTAKEVAKQAETSLGETEKAIQKLEKLGYVKIDSSRRIAA